MVESHGNSSAARVATLSDPTQSRRSGADDRPIRKAIELVVSRYRRHLETFDGTGDRERVALIASQAPRIEFILQTVVDAIPQGGKLADIGGGLTPCCHAMSLLGYRTVLVDDFGDRGYAESSWMLDQKRKDGVEILSCDVLSDLPLPENSFDAVMTHDCLEHLHNSPKKMLQQCVAALKPGGFLFLGVPNSVNLRKRLTVPFGIGKWSTMNDWYESDAFRGHVREPDIDDLAYIARSLGLEDVRIFGRNWLGYESHFGLVRLLTPFGDRLLQLWPGLCANIYMSGAKPRA